MTWHCMFNTTGLNTIIILVRFSRNPTTDKKTGGAVLRRNLYPLLSTERYSSRGQGVWCSLEWQGNSISKAGWGSKESTTGQSEYTSKESTTGQAGCTRTAGQGDCTSKESTAGQGDSTSKESTAGQGDSTSKESTTRQGSKESSTGQGDSTSKKRKSTTG